MIAPRVSESDGPRETRSRRRVLASLGSVGACVLAGCNGTSTGETTAPPGTTGARTGDATIATGARTTTSPGTDDGDGSRLLYLYGDVAADGTVPSGDAEPFHQMRLSDTGPRGLSEFADVVEGAGLEPVERYDAETTLSRSVLDGFDVVVLGSNQHRFESDEADAVGEWVSDGGGLLAWSDSAFGGDYREVGVCNPAGSQSNNDLTEQFGMTFLRDNGAGNYRVRRYTEDHYLNDGDADGGVVFRGEGVSPVRVSRPAEVLAKLQSGGLDGRLEVCDRDAPFEPDRDGALAVATVGDGRVVGTFDRNTFWNGGAGTNISEADNRAFVGRLVGWLAGAE